MLGLVAKITLERVIKQLSLKNVVIQSWFLNLQIVFFIFLAILTLLAQMHNEKLYTRALASETHEEANERTQEYDRAIFVAYILNTLAWIFINLCMMVMISSHQKSL